MDWLISLFAFAVAIGAYVEAAARNNKLEKRVRALEEKQHGEENNKNYFA